MPCWWRADADVERAAHAAVWGAFYNAGQSCIAIERCYVQQSVAEVFTRRVVELTGELSQGLAAENTRQQVPGELPEHDLGPLCTQFQFDHVKELVHDAVRQGARIEIGGRARQRG